MISCDVSVAYTAILMAESYSTPSTGQNVMCMNTLPTSPAANYSPRPEHSRASSTLGALSGKPVILDLLHFVCLDHFAHLISLHYLYTQVGVSTGTMRKYKGST